MDIFGGGVVYRLLFEGAGMKGFSVGDVCVIIFSTHRPHLVGREVVIARELRMTKAVHLDGSSDTAPRHRIEADWLAYEPRAVANEFWSCKPEHLRLKRPPNKDEFTAGEWELCPFQPYKAKERVT